jgi:hypothetical protein
MTIEERISQAVGQLSQDIAAVCKRVDQLVQVHESHEREEQRFRAALRAGLGENGDPPKA